MQTRKMRRQAWLRTSATHGLTSAGMTAPPLETRRACISQLNKRLWTYTPARRALSNVAAVMGSS